MFGRTYDYRTFPGPPDELWVRDGAGLRRVAVAQGIGGLHLEGSTVSWTQSDRVGVQQLELIG